VLKQKMGVAIEGVLDAGRAGDKAHFEGT